MSSTISSLYHDRCKVVDGKHIPTFWQPVALDPEPMCVYGDRRNPSSPEWQQVCQRIISLALDLEVEVGGYVLKGITKELPSADATLVPLLKSNAADESRHFRGFQYAQERYGSSGNAKLLSKLWGIQTDKQHPVAIAGILEAGVFLVSLGILRVFGGPALTKLSMAIAEDEFRHVCTNYAVAKALGAWSPMRDNLDLVDATLEWIMGDFKGEGVWNLTNMRRWSRELLHDQDSPEFDGLTWYTTHTPPFEVSNSHLYTYREA